MKSFKVVIVCCLITISQCLSYVSDGMLDRAFSHMVSQTLPVAKAVCVQHDGKMVIAGYVPAEGKKSFAVARLLSNGMLDKDFGNNGVTLVQFGNGETASSAQAIMIDCEGRIVAGGFTNAIKNTPHWALARLTANGNLDKSFFGGRATFKGTVVNTFNSLEELSHINGLAESVDGKIVAVGGMHANKATQFVIARYNSNGSLDKTFNPNANDAAGMVCTQFGTAYNMNDEATTVAIDAHGKIVVGGSSYLTGVKTFALARYHQDGSLDTSFFGGNAQLRGTVVTNFACGETEGCIKSLVIQADGKIVAGGYTNARSENKDITHFALARYTAQGQLDVNFSADSAYRIPGTIITNFGSEKTSSGINALVLQSDGKVVAGGWTKFNKTKYASLARYNPDGSLDYQFNGGGAPAGKVITDMPNGDSEICGLAFAPTGDILAVGKNCCNLRSTGAVMQYMCDQDLCNPEINKPSNNQIYIDGSAVKLMGKCHCPSMLRIYVNDKLLDTVCSKGNCANWTYTLPPLVSGDYEITVIENYNGGKIQNLSNSVSITVDQCPHIREQYISVCGKNPVSGKLAPYGASGCYIFNLESADNGTVELNGADFVFTPSIEAGEGSFTFYVTDLTTACSVKGKMHVMIHEIPTLISNVFDTCNSTNINANLFSFVKGGSAPYKAKIVEGSAHGLITTREDGSFTFIPANDFVGKTSFTYQVVDVHGAVSPVQTMHINVDPAPRACNLEYKTCQNKYLQGALSSNACIGIPPYHFTGYTSTHGKVAVEKNGMFMFFPEKDYLGLAEFEFSFTDAKQRSSQKAKVIIDVQPGPSLKDCTIIAHQGLTKRGSLVEHMVNGSAPYQFALVEKPRHGQMQLEADGNFTYTCSNSLDDTTDSFEFIVKDVHGCTSNRATAHINIYPKPQARDISVETYMNQPLKHDLQRALIFAKSPYFFQTRGSVEHGTVSIEQDGSFTFVPEKDYRGTALVKYVIVDSFGIESDPATISVMIHAPTISHNGKFELVENKTASFPIAQLVTGGVPPYTLQLTNGCEFQTCDVTIDAEGMLHVMPKSNYNGVTSCNYKAIDKNGNCSVERTIRLVVHPAPVASDMHIEVYEHSQVTGSLQERTSKGLPPYQYMLVDSNNGQAIVHEDGSFEFRPTDGAVGMGSFKYMVMDARQAQSKMATVYCAIQEVPKIHPVAYTAYHNQTLFGDLNHAQHTSKGVAPYTYMLVGQPTNGSVVINTDGTFNFTPSNEDNASFQYQVVDAKGGTSLLANVNVTIYSPVCVQNAEFTTEQEASYKGTLAAYINGGVQPYTMQVTAMKNGKVELSQDGSFTFTPALDFVGDASFEYQVVDRTNGSNASGKVTMHVMQKAVETIVAELDVNKNETRNLKSKKVNKRKVLTHLKRK